MRRAISLTVLTLCALEAVFWIATSAASDDVARANLEDRCATNLNVAPEKVEVASDEHSHDCNTHVPGDACRAAYDGLPAKQPIREAPVQHYGLRDSDEPDEIPQQKTKPGGDHHELNKNMEQGLFEAAWRHMTTHFTLFDIAVYGSALLHLALTLSLSVWPLVLQNVPGLQKHKIQQNVPPASVTDWTYVLFVVMASQLVVQLPLVTGQFLFVTHFGTPYSYETIPAWWDIAWRLLAALVIEDTWHYWLHRALHHKCIYRYIHKMHHTYTAPFSLQAEYAHPIETVVLGAGFFIPLLLFTTHLCFMWSWLAVRLIETTDVHSGYDLPFNPLKLIPGYAGVRHHDFHHRAFTANYSSTFVWWDWWCGTGMEAHDAALRRKDVEARVAAMRSLVAAPAPSKAAVATPPSTAELRIPGAHCLVTGALGMVGWRLVTMLAERGASRVVCLDVRPEPFEWAKTAQAMRKEHGCELDYASCDISDQAALEATGGPFQGVSICIHVAALVGPFFPSALYDSVNHQGARNVLQACKAHGCPVLVDCSSPSTRFNGKDICGAQEEDLHYAYVHEYARTKALGEKVILEANGDGIATVAVAPHQVYGPEDLLFLPAMLETARTGRLRLFGSGDNVVSFTHVDNICHGLCLAAQELQRNGPTSPAAGHFFVVTDGDSGVRNFWDTIDEAVVACGMPSLHSKAALPTVLLSLVAYTGALFTAITGKMVKLTPFTLNMLVIHRYFCIHKAEQLLRYHPVVSFDEGWGATVEAVKARMGFGAQNAAQGDAGPLGRSDGTELHPGDGSWLAPNCMKRHGEKFFLWFAVAWIGLMAAIVATRAFEWFSPMQYLYVGIAIFVPCFLLPAAVTDPTVSLPWYEQYMFKNNVWCFILTFYGLWCWQIYFYTVLCTRYTFSQNTLRFNNVPITLFGITQGYFTFYHTISDMVLRSYHRWAGWATPGQPAPWALKGMLGYAAFIGVFSLFVAFLETFTIQNFEPYEIYDREAMYKYGSVFYALYFVVSFPMHFSLDETKVSTLRETVLNAFASCGIITLLLDMWRIFLGPIVPQCPFEEAQSRIIPFVQP